MQDFGQEYYPQDLSLIHISTLINKAKELREDIRQREDTIRDMANYVDSIKSIKTGLEIAVNNIDAVSYTHLEATMEQTGVDEVTGMEKDAAKLWFTSLTSGVIVEIGRAHV